MVVEGPEVGCCGVEGHVLLLSTQGNDVLLHLRLQSSHDSCLGPVLLHVSHVESPGGGNTGHVELFLSACSDTTDILLYISSQHNLQHSTPAYCAQFSWLVIPAHWRSVASVPLHLNPDTPLPALLPKQELLHDAAA